MVTNPIVAVAKMGIDAEARRGRRFARGGKTGVDTNFTKGRETGGVDESPPNMAK